MRAAIVKAMPATGYTKIVCDQPPGNQSLDLKLGQKRILLIFIHRRDAECAEKAYYLLTTFLCGFCVLSG